MIDLALERRKAIALDALRRRKEQMKELRERALLPKNEDLEAGMPMIYFCIECGAPIFVDEEWVAKQEHCGECQFLIEQGWLNYAPPDFHQEVATSDTQLVAFLKRCDEAAFNLYVLNDKREVVKAASIDDWVAMKMDFENRCRVARDQVGEIDVSTVFLGTDMNHMRVLRPELPTMCFETMIFGPDRSDVEDRYSTWEEAAAGHQAVVERLKTPTVHVDSGEEAIEVLRAFSRKTKE